MKIALLDYKVVRTNPIGGIHRIMLEGLCQEHNFTVFAVEFDNPCPELIKFVRIPVPSRPLALLYVCYLLIAPLYFFWERFRNGPFDIVHFVESNFWRGHVSRVGFCHRRYLRQHWQQTKPGGLRGVIRWLDHWLHAVLEPLVYRLTNRIVVPSRGLQQELEEEYPHIKNKITLISNPVETQRFKKPQDFDRCAFRNALGVSQDSFVLSFVALGQFERKGLPLILEALQKIPQAHLLVVGGTSDTIGMWKNRIESLGLTERVYFTGIQKDIRPFLWCADAFVFPSVYETFSQVTFQAAAAGLPLIVTPLYGVEEFMEDCVMGFLVDRSEESVAEAIKKLLTLSPAERSAMGERSRAAVERFSVERFIESWRFLYKAIGTSQ
ncbi:MAG: glycosyltransferase family 4 protein [Desulfurococcaceae archaeon]